MTIEEDLEIMTEDILRQIKRKKWIQVSMLIEELYELTESEEYPSDL